MGSISVRYLSVVAECLEREGQNKILPLPALFPHHLSHNAREEPGNECLQYCKDCAMTDQHDQKSG